jgi:hypothetical protein
MRETKAFQGFRTFSQEDAARTASAADLLTLQTRTPVDSRTRRFSRRRRLRGPLAEQAERPLGTVTLTRGGATRIGRCLTTPTELTRTASRSRNCEIPPKRRPPGRDCPPNARREGRTPDALAPRPRVAPRPWLPMNSGPLVKENRRIHRPDTFELQSELANSLKAARTTITSNYAFR